MRGELLSSQVVKPSSFISGLQREWREEQGYGQHMVQVEATSITQLHVVFTDSFYLRGFISSFFQIIIDTLNGQINEMNICV